MSTILDALRRLQADRDELLPSRDLKKQLTEPRSAGLRRRRSLLSRTGMGAVSLVGGVGLGVALGVWTFSGGNLSGAESGPGVSAPEGDAQPPGQPRSPGNPLSNGDSDPALVPAAQPIADRPSETLAPLARRTIADLREADAVAEAELDGSQRVSSSAPTDLPAVQGPRAGDMDGRRAAPRPIAEPPPPAPGGESRSVPRGFSAIAERRPEDPAEPGRPSKAVAGTRPAQRAAAPRPPQRVPEGRSAPETRPPREPAPPPPPEMAPAVEDPIGFPALTVGSVRWHPDPKRREANVEVDGAVAISAREGDLVGGALLARIAPGEVEFKVGMRSKVIRVGK